MKREAVVLALLSCALAGAGPAAAERGARPPAFLALSGAEAAGFVAPADMHLVRRLPLEALGLTYERYQQRSGGADVLGGQVTLFRDASGTITTVIGAHYPRIASKNGVTLTRAHAQRVTEQDLGKDGERSVSLMLDPATGRHFYRVETRRRHFRWFHWIDAADGRVLRQYDGRQTDHGAGVKGDTKSLLGPDGSAATGDDLTRFHGSSGHGASGPHWDLISADGRQTTYDARNGTYFVYSVTDADNHWTSVTADRSSPGQPALVDAQYYARVADEYFRDRHGLDWITGCGYAELRSVAHYGADYNNAFWDGAEVVYGDGDGFFLRELSGALDVVAHEHTHGITECTSNLIYQDESGALNESFSDMLGSSGEFYADGRGLDPAATPDWRIGEDVFLLGPGLRNMADPAEEGDPDHYSERYVGPEDNGGVHINSGIPNHAFYLLVNGGSNAGEAQGHPHSGPLVIGIGVAAAERIFFQGFTGLPQNATMCDARAATEAAASALFGAASLERASTTDAWLAVGLTDEACGLAPIPAPTDLTATALSTSRVRLAWTDNATAEAGYKVERSTDGSAFVEIATLGPNVESHSDTGLAASASYSYRVRAYAGPSHSDYSNVAQATTQDPPAAPTSLTAAAVSTSRINLAWVDNATNEAGYRVERSTDGVSFAVIATLGLNAKSYSNLSLAGGTLYHYRVHAYEGPNNSEHSNVASATTQPTPAAPTSLAATAVSSSRINLTWVDNATNEAGFKVERSTDGVSFTQLVTLGVNSTSYSNTNLPAQSQYHYRVRAYEGPNHSAYSNVASSTTLPPPAAPSGLTATAASSSRINLTWVDNATYEAGFKVERSGDGVTFSQIAVVGANVKTYSNTNLTAETQYQYRVRAYDGPNYSAYSNVASATTQPPPAAPTNLTATAVSTSRINLAWVDNATAEAGFKIERSTDGVTFTQIISLGANATSYSNTNLTGDTQYHYRIRAYDGPNHSAYSSVASATTQPPPAAPTNLTATAVSSSRINLAWVDNATTEAGFKVERSTDGVSFTQIISLGANAKSASNINLTAETQYHYRVRAYDGPNNSAYSNLASATTQPPPAAPTNLTATAVSSSRINLAWVDNATTEAGFKVERSTDGVSFTQIISLGANAKSASNINLTAETQYHYRIRAYDGPNHSAYSSVASATTQPPPAAPTNLTATAVSTSRINLAWTDNAANEGGFKVERSINGVSFSLIASLGANVTSYASSGLSSQTGYSFRVRAYEGPNYSTYSNVAQATTQ